MASVLVLGLFCTALFGCGKRSEHGPTVVTFPGSDVGAEGALLRRQLARFMREHPEIRVVQQRSPDAAGLRHQLYVQWLNARAPDPDILQLDVVWMAEFAAAGWLLALDRFAPARTDFFPATLAAARHGGRLYALPWFVDVGMLYYRSDVFPDAPRTQAELHTRARVAKDHGIEHGLLWQGARYEGLLTVFLEYLTAYGGEILNSDGKVMLASAQARAALEAMQHALATGAVPRAALAFQEEQTRFAFQEGRALFMRNWPYAYPLMQAQSSKVAGRFAVTAMPPAPGGQAAATLGGSLLAINAHSDHPGAAYAVLNFLLAPAQMLERARVVGQFPPRPSLYQTRELAAALPVPAARALEIVSHAVARPSTPVYSELSDILQVHLHRCLTGQETSEDALARAARELEALLARVGLLPGPGEERGHGG